MMLGPIQLGNLTLDLHPMFLGALAAILGYQILSIGIFSKLYAYNRGLEKAGATVKYFEKHFSLERMLYLGGIFLALGLAMSFWILWTWKQTYFGELFEIRKTLVALTLIVIGIQTMFSAFFFSLLSLPTKKQN